MNKAIETPGARTIGAFALAVVFGGANFVGVRFSNGELDPFWGAGLRFSLAALTFVVIAFALRLPWPRGKLLALTAAYGLLSFGLFYALMYWALQRVTAGMATVVMAMVPLVTVLLTWGQRLEPLRRSALVGAAVAMAGIVWMTLGEGSVDLPLTGLLAMLAAAVTVGESVILGKKVSANHPAMTNAVAMVVGAGSLLALSAVAGERWLLPSQPEVVWSLVYLVTLGSVGLFVLMLLVVRRWTASATSYAFVLFPVVTMLLEAWLADEPLTLRGVTGALIVMAGVWFGALAPSARHSASPPAAAPAPAEAH
jgi:drug/metabolite transporter (DMT)-like permease